MTWDKVSGCHRRAQSRFLQAREHFPAKAIQTAFIVQPSQQEAIDTCPGEAREEPCDVIRVSHQRIAGKSGFQSVCEFRSRFGRHRSGVDCIVIDDGLNGRVVASGVGSAALDHPLNSVAWLARKLGEYGRSLRAGELVMTGSLVRQFPLAPGDHARASFSGIGRVEVRLTQG